MVGVAAAVFVNPAPVSAAGVVWTAGTPVAVPGTVDTAITASLGPGGTGFVVSGIYRNGNPAGHLVAPIDAAGNVGAGVTIARAYGVPSEIDPDGRSLLVARASGHVVWAQLGVDAHLGRPHRVAGAVTTDSPRLFTNPAGDALIVWSQKREGKKAVRFVVRTAAGRVSRATWLQDPAGWSGFAGAAIGPERRLVFTSISGRRTRGQRLYATTGIRTRLREATPVGRAPYTTEVTAVIDGRGRTYLAWRSQNIDPDLGPSEPNGPWQLQVASISGGSGRVRSAQTMDRAARADGGTGFPTLVANPGGGGAVVGFTRATGDDATTPAVAAASSSGRFAKFVVLARDGFFGSLASRADGASLITWRTKTQVLAAKITDGVVGTAEDTGLGAMPGTIGFAPGAGQPVVLGYPSAGAPSAQLLRSVRSQP